MKILLVIKSLAAGGGAEKVLAEVAEALCKRCHHVVVVTFDRPGASDFYHLPASVGREYLEATDHQRHMGAFDFLRIIGAARQLLHRMRADIAIGFMNSAFVPLTFAAIGSGTPVIASEHISYDHYRQRPLQRALLNIVHRLCAAMTITLDSVREGFPATIRRKMITVPNPLTFKPKRRKHVDGAKRLLFVGNFRPQKAHATLISAFGRVASDCPNWELRLVGDGELRHIAEEQVRHLNLGFRVVFTGAIDDVAEEYARAEIFVIPSSYESFGLATAEALRSGLPVVGYADCPGTNELVEQGVNGILVGRQDPVATLAEALFKLMSDADLRRRMGLAGPASVTHYSLDTTADRWEALIKRVVEQHAHRGGAEQ